MTSFGGCSVRFVLLTALANSLSFALYLSVSSAYAEPIEVAGTASVIDGDTIEVHGQRIRLYGIDAPESAQLCEDASGKDYRCGQRAALALADKIGRQTVRCEGKTTDRYGRVVAVCYLKDEDLGAWLVREGLAIDYRRYSSDYLDEEQAARQARRGLWEGSFEEPWEWRKPTSEGASRR